jgi:TolA-binding protein
MTRLCRWILASTLLLGAASQLPAASSEEQRDFAAATKSFNDGFYARAETGFASFVQTYTNSTLLPEVILFQARARLEQTNYAGAIELLSSRLSAAGTNADQYAFSLAEAYARKGDNRAAADAFAKLTKDFPASPRRLEAAINQAGALAALAEWPRVIELLRDTNGVFQTAARTNAASKLVPQGYLLLGEALLAQKDFRAAEATLLPLGKRQLDPQIAWRWQFLLCRVLLADGRAEEALQNTTNLVALADAASQPGLQAESTSFKARLLEGLGRPAQAISTYEQNLAPSRPPEKQRQALLKITELFLAQTNLAAAVQTLEKFLAQFPQAPAADRAWLALGELRLRQHAGGLNTNLAPNVATNAGATTHYLQLALESFQTLAKNFPQSSLFGQGQLWLGWCLWLQGQIPESQRAFQAAVERLPLSLDLARAHFKLGDAQFLQKDFAGAITNYNAIISGFAGLPEIETNLFEQALYQTVQAGLAGGDLPAVTNALRKILTSYPNSFYTERAVLLGAPAISRRGNPAEARRWFSDYLKTAPQADLRPEVELAIARTYEQEKKWSEAVQQYESWLGSFTNHEARPRAEYYLARANFWAGNETNSLSGFTNFVAHFPTNELAPLAQWWVADYYFGIGDFQRAENDYQVLSRNWPGTELDFQAQMMAGHAAVKRASWENAKDYFLRLYNATNRCPEGLRAEAFFAYGDYWMSHDSTNKQADFEEAIKVFTKICDEFPTNRLVSLAWGEKANCLLQWAQYSHQYDTASNAFQQVIRSPAADSSARSTAKVGLGVVLEKQAAQKTGEEQAALLKLALDQYLDVLYGNILRDGEKPDLFWLRRAGLDASRLAGDLREWRQAVNICSRLQELLPSLRASLEEKKLKFQKNLDPPPN